MGLHPTGMVRLKLLGQPSLAAILLFSGALIGCGATVRLYDGPERQRAEVAVIDGYATSAWAVLRYQELRPERVDDKYLSPCNEIQLLPGSHKLKVKYEDHISSPGGQFVCTKYAEFQADLKAGQGYELDFENKESALTIWLAEKGSKQRVGEGTTRSCEVF